MNDLLITLVIILLVVFAIIMVADKMYNKSSQSKTTSSAYTSQTEQAGQVSQPPSELPASPIDVSPGETGESQDSLLTQDQLAILQELETRTPEKTSERLAYITRICEDAYAGRVFLDEARNLLNKKIKKVFNEGKLGEYGFRDDAAPRYNCDRLIDALRIEQNAY